MQRHTLLRGKRSLGLAMIFVLCSSLPVYAATPTLDPRQPDAGRIADSVKDREITASPKSNVQIEVTEDQPEAEPSKEGAKFQVNSYRITGIEDISDLALREDKLQDMVQDATGKEMTLGELKAVARRIAKYFQEQGYMVAHAYIPAQKLRDGIVEIAVAPGRYDSIELHNHSRLSESTAQKMLSSIKTGSYVKKGKLERALLLLSDTGGISIKATLQPGKTPGTTTLVVDIKNTDALSADLSMNNYGNRFTGKDLRSFNLDAHNISGQGDQLRMHVDNSGGGLTNAGIDYVLPMGGKGFKLGVGYEQLHYSLGQDFESLDAYGTAKNTNIYGSYPLVRSRNRNLYATIGYSRKRLEDQIDAQYTFTERHANVWSLGLSGDSRDEYQGGGVNNFALTFTAGRLHIDGGTIQNIISAQENDREGAQTAGTFAKANLNFNRLQYLNDHTNLYLSFSGQLASKNLDSAEKMYLGGGNGVRAYPQGEASGDQGYLLTAELRFQMPRPEFQLVAFIDHGHVDGNRNYYAGAAADRTLSGIGIGAIYAHSKQYILRLDYAWKLGNDKATADDDKNGRFWLRGTRYFE